MCAFGVPARDAVGDIALVGDSHAWHWRAGVAFVARALHWHGLDSTRTTCSFSWCIPRAPEPQRAACAKWNRAFVRWLRQRPEITTVFTSNHPESVRAAPHQDGFSAQVAGIKAAWAALPPTVKHIIVIRDIPYMPANVLQCVEDAIRRRLNAGLSCAQPRARALLRDPDVAAAELVHSRRVEVFDPTRFFCDSHLCYPVVGGALVYRNADHLTETFAASVGPYLLHALIRLMTSWR